MKCAASGQPDRAGWLKRLILLLTVTALLPAPIVPVPSLAAAEDVVITATVFLNPLEIQVSAQPRVAANAVFTVQAVVTNHGDLSIEKAAAVIHLPGDVQLVRSKPEVKLGRVPAHTEITAAWQVRALRKGNYVILVSVSGMYNGAAVTGEDAVMVIVKD